MRFSFSILLFLITRIITVFLEDQPKIKPHCFKHNESKPKDILDKVFYIIKKERRWEDNLQWPAPLSAVLPPEIQVWAMEEEMHFCSSCLTLLESCSEKLCNEWCRASSKIQSLWSSPFPETAQPGKGWDPVRCNYPAQSLKSLCNLAGQSRLLPVTAR